MNRFVFAILLLFLVPNCKDNLCVLHLESPNYPRLARYARIQGEVRVQTKIGADGRVLSARATTGHQLLKQEAEDNIRKWIFSSGKEQVIEVIYEFQLVEPEVYNDPPPRVVFDLPRHVKITSNFGEINPSK